MNVLDLIEQDNVVYIKTYKAAKQAASTSFVPYKNAFYSMNEEQRSIERRRINDYLLINQFDFMARLYKRAQEQVDNE